MSREKLDSFKEAVKPLQLWMREQDFHPHTFLIVSEYEASVNETTMGLSEEVED